MFPGRSGKGISRCTVWRWMLTGHKGHKLDSLLAGGTRVTSKEAVARFLAAINGRGEGRRERQDAGQTRADRAVEDELRAAGF